MRTHSMPAPPHSSDAEMGVLGSILINPEESMPKCRSEGIQSGWFYDRRHEYLYESLTTMFDSGFGMDSLTIASKLKSDDALERVGGYAYLTELQDTAFVTGHIESYCEIMRGHYRRRNIISKATDAIEQCYDEDDPDAVIAELTIDLSGAARANRNPITTDSMIKSYEDAANGHSRCIPTPFGGLTMKTGGPMRGMETILTGRSKSGKSMLKSFWHHYLGKQNIPALDCAWEDGEFISKSRCASIGSYNASRVIRGGSHIRMNDKWAWSPLRQNEIDTARRKLTDLEELPLYWDSRRLSPDDLLPTLDYYVKKHGIQIAFLDGAKDIKRPSGEYNSTGFDEEISSIITDAARELDIAIVSIYHLTKLAHDELIRSTNIRGSGQIVSNSRLVYALQGDKNGASLDQYMSAKPLNMTEDGYCNTRVLECIDNNHAQTGMTWLDCDLGLCSFEQMK